MRRQVCRFVQDCESWRLIEAREGSMLVFTASVKAAGRVAVLKDGLVRGLRGLISHDGVLSI